MKQISMLFLVLLLSSFVIAQDLSKDVITKEDQANLTPEKVLQEMKDGNERFLSGNTIKRDYKAQIAATSTGQFPKALVLSCIDSRVPVEIVFDKGFGDVFVGRVAGNVEDVNILGSFEYGAAVAGSKLIVVLGHTECGAVKGAVDYDAVAKLGIENLNNLLKEINPAVESALKNGGERSSKNKSLVNDAIKENVLLTIEHMRKDSPTLAQLEADGKVMIVGAVYDISTGKVNWL